MYLYNIGYGTCEESEYHQFYHTTKYTDEELEDIVVQCFCEIIEYSAGRFDETGDHDNPRLWVNEKGIKFSELMGEPIFNELLEKKGFKQVEFVARFSCFGWASAMLPGDWKSWASEKNETYQTRIKEFCEKKGIIIEQFKDKDGDERDNYRLNWKK